MYPSNKLIDLKIIDMSGYSLLLNNHFTDNGFPTFAFTVLLLIVTQEFIDRKLFILVTAEIFHKCPIGLDIFSLMVSGYPTYVEIDILQAH